MADPSLSPPSFMAIWHALIDGYNLICRAAPDYEARLFRDSGQILAGEPHADMNFAFVGCPLGAERHLRLFHERASARELPMLLLGTEATAPCLAPRADNF